MSEILITLPDDNWFEEGCITPEDGEICVIIHVYGSRAPEICQFRKADGLHSGSDYFMNISEKWYMDSLGCGEEWVPSFAAWGIVELWKPLGLPEDVDKRIKKQIEMWLEDNE